MILRTAEFLREHGVRLMRAGAFKPRSSPYAFQGMGLEGLDILARVRREDRHRHRHRVDGHRQRRRRRGGGRRHPDRHAQHAELQPAQARVARRRKPVLLKRGLSATLEEWLMAAEYVMAGGNYNVVLCERGVRTFSDHSRNTLDLSVIPPAKHLSHLPILVDPSHGTGKRDYVPRWRWRRWRPGPTGC